MSDNRNGFAVIDRRGKQGEVLPDREVAPPPKEPAGSGTTMGIRCGTCSADVSDRCMVAQIVLPQPSPLGDGITFAPQAVFFLPLVCPHCGACQVQSRQVVPVSMAKPA